MVSQYISICPDTKYNFRAWFQYTTGSVTAGQCFIGLQLGGMLSTNLSQVATIDWTNTTASAINGEILTSNVYTTKDETYIPIYIVLFCTKFETLIPPTGFIDAVHLQAAPLGIWLESRMGFGDRIELPIRSHAVCLDQTN
jgi:hypothetical protein